MSLGWRRFRRARLSTEFHKYGNVPVLAPARPVRAVIRWPSATALGYEIVSLRKPREGRHAYFPPCYAARRGGSGPPAPSLPRLLPWAILCRPLGPRLTEYVSELTKSSTKPPALPGVSDFVTADADILAGVFLPRGEFQQVCNSYGEQAIVGPESIKASTSTKRSPCRTRRRILGRSTLRRLG
jgi:hypothetical protein